MLMVEDRCQKVGIHGANPGCDPSMAVAQGVGVQFKTCPLHSLLTSPGRTAWHLALGAWVEPVKLLRPPAQGGQHPSHTQQFWMDTSES